MHSLLKYFYHQRVLEVFPVWRLMRVHAHACAHMHRVCQKRKKERSKDREERIP